MARSLRPMDIFPITTRHLHVRRVQDLTQGMRRVTLAGEQLAAHVAANGFEVAAFRSGGFDDELKVILKHPDAAEPVGPTQADGVLSWPRDNPHLLLRTYTVRRWDPDAGELDLDFVQHGIGPATTWARRAQPGDAVQIAGPKASSHHPVGVDWVLVAGDETALPSIGRWLESWPAGARGQVFIEVAEASHVQELPQPDGVELTWLCRDGAKPGSTTLLHDAITAAEWWPGTPFAWIAGEALTLAPIRRWLRTEKGLDRSHVEVTGYWRREAVTGREDDPSLPEETGVDDWDRFHDLSELFSGFVLRVAATIGLADALSTGPRSVEDLAAALGGKPTGIGKLVRYLESLGLLERDGTRRCGLTDLGRQLQDDDVADDLRLDGPAALRELGAALSLLSALLPGQRDDPAWFDRSALHTALRSEPVLRMRLEEESDYADYAAGALASAPIPAELRSVLVTGEAAGRYAHALVRNNPALRATVLADATEVDLIRSIEGDHDRIALVPGTLRDLRPDEQDAVLLVTALQSLPDADAITVLKAAATGVRPGGRLLVFGGVLDPGDADDHDFGEDLVAFALDGGGLRTDAEHRALFTAAGLGAPTRSTIGWGETLYAFAPTPS